VTIPPTSANEQQGTSDWNPSRFRFIEVLAGCLPAVGPEFLAISYSTTFWRCLSSRRFSLILMDFPVRYFKQGQLPRWLAIRGVQPGCCCVDSGPLLRSLGFRFVKPGASALATDVLSKYEIPICLFTETLNQINLDSILSVLSSSFGDGLSVHRRAFQQCIDTHFSAGDQPLHVVDDGRLLDFAARLVPARSRHTLSTCAEERALDFCGAR